MPSHAQQERVIHATFGKEDAEQRVLRILVECPTVWPMLQEHQVGPLHFVNRINRKLFEGIEAACRDLFADGELQRVPCRSSSVTEAEFGEACEVLVKRLATNRLEYFARRLAELADRAAKAATLPLEPSGLAGEAHAIECSLHDAINFDFGGQIPF